MALFGKQSALQRALTSSWRNLEERDEVIAQLRTSGHRSMEVIPLLWHADAALRQAGADLFVARPDAGAVGTVLEKLGEQPSHIRSYVARVFARLPSEIMQRVVDDLLASRLAPRKRLGWEVGIVLNAPLRWRYLERAVTEAPVMLRVPALQQLLQDKPAGALIPLLISAAKDEDARLAAMALEALARLDAPQVVELMLVRLAQGDATSRDRAAAYLREAAKARPLELRRKLLDQLGSGEDATRYACVQILLGTGKADEVLVDILTYCRNMLGWLRTRILDTLKSFGDRVFEPALQLLDHPDGDVRASAMVLAENFNDPRLVEPLCRMLVAGDWWLRLSACDTLGRLKDPRAVPALIRALEDPDIRWSAIDALGQVATPTALEPLMGLVHDPREEVRLEVLRVISRFNDRRLPSLLQQVMLKDASSEVRRTASQALKTLAQRKLVVDDIETPTVELMLERLNTPLDRLLTAIRDEGASDLHITVGEPPLVRHHGDLVRRYEFEGGLLEAEHTRDAILEILSPHERQLLEQRGEIDFCYTIPDVGRYRVNAYQQRLGLCASFRVIPNQPPSFADLRLPARLTELLDYHQGLIVISGPAGSGKSTTLAAIVNLLNETKPLHLITLEDPIEFVHPVKSALLNQRQVGQHTRSFSRALRAALREDPDIIVVGEMRDLETIRLALTAAETGHLVIATLHTTSAVQTVERMIKSFPPDEQPQVRMALSESLKYVICQSLIPRKDGRGRLAVFEILKGVMSISTLIRENKTHQLPSMMQLGQSVGMQTADQGLLELMNAGLITPEAAWLRAERPENFEAFCSPALLKDMRFIE